MHKKGPSLNFNKCSWDLINASLHGTDWQRLLTDLTTIDCFNIFMETVSRICQCVVPLYKKQSSRNSKYYRERKTLIKKEPNSRQGSYVGCPGTLNLENLILSLESDILNSHKS